MYQGTHTGDGAATLHLKFETGRIRDFNRDVLEPYPLEFLSYIITTTDITTARTATLSLYAKHDSQQLIIYDVSPNLDNNTIELKSYMIVEDGATAGTDALTGSNFGFKCTSGTYIDYILSGTVDNTDTQVIRILYTGYEKMKVTALAGTWVENYHEDLGVF